jgi:hypothetical protein
VTARTFSCQMAPFYWVARTSRGCCARVRFFARFEHPKKSDKRADLVYKNRGLNPWDVRVLRAVDCSELHHLEDVVVFPQLGKRPEPGNLSSRDLVTFSTFQPCFPPAIYENAC